MLGQKPNFQGSKWYGNIGTHSQKGFSNILKDMKSLAKKYVQLFN